MGKRKSLSKKLWGRIFIFAAFVLALILCTNIMQSILWKNSNEMGLSLVKNFSSAEEQNIKTCEAMLDICTDYVREREQAGAPPEEILQGLDPFMNGPTCTGMRRSRSTAWCTAGSLCRTGLRT